jgi:hypothetical protein
MARAQDDPQNPIAQAINGFTDLYARQVDTHEYRVLSLRNRSVTAHQVDIEALSCSCKDEAYNQDDPEICDHVATALFAADQGMSFESYAGHHLETLVSRAHEAVRSIEDVRDVAQAAQSANAEAAAQDGSDPDTMAWNGDPVEEFKALLRDAGLDPDVFKLWVDDDRGSLQVDQDGYLEDGDFGTWVDLSDDLDLGYDGDADVNYLPAEDFPEVFG